MGELISQLFWLWRTFENDDITFKEQWFDRGN